MRVHRSHPDAGFTIIPNSVLQDQRLSTTARGVLVELLSRPDGWQTNAETMVEQARATRPDHAEGRRTMRSAFAELEAAGYLVHTRLRGPDGRVRTETDVYDVPRHRGTASGTSVRPATMPETAAHTDIPDAVARCPPAETRKNPGRTEVPHPVPLYKETEERNEVIKNQAVDADASTALREPGIAVNAGLASLDAAAAQFIKSLPALSDLVVDDLITRSLNGPRHRMVEWAYGEALKASGWPEGAMTTSQQRQVNEEALVIAARLAARQGDRYLLESWESAPDGVARPESALAAPF